MAPGRPRRVQVAQPQSQSTQNEQQEQQEYPALFIDPMMGTPLPIYVDKDVEDRDNIVRLITSHGGTVSPNYSGVPYILVDPHKQSGQNLYRHYLGKKGKIVLASQWVYECIRLNQLQTFHSNYAECKVTGKEQIHINPPEPSNQQPQAVQSVPPPQQTSSSTPLRNRPPTPEPSAARSARNDVQPVARQNGVATQHTAMAPMQGHRPGMQAMAPGMIPPGVSVDGLTFTSYALFGQDMSASGGAAPPPPPPPQPQPQPQPNGTAVGPTPAPRVQPEGAPPPPWQGTTGIAPSQTHLNPPPPPPPPPGQEQIIHRPQTHWDGYSHNGHPAEAIPGPSTGETYEYRYRDDGNGNGQWVQAQYYDPGYEQAYQPAYPEVPNNGVAGPLPVPPAPDGNAQAGPSTQPEADEDRPRGRKRTRTQPPPAAPASSLVVNKNTAARSPTPPSRIIKSTYGGNLFTADDVYYLKKYIDYCRDQGLVLSLREICERIAIRAPHHTFYSWRRYCNKHQIRLGGYVMSNNANTTSDNVRGESAEGDWEMDVSDSEPAIQVGPPTDYSNEQIAQQSKQKGPRNRSPTPPRALFRSTTGKGVAFTTQDRDFLISFMEYRKAQGRLDMVQFWKDVATKAPHHSRASWMKYWRRHKHEFNRTEADAPLPPAPEKKMRYSKQDDILLAKYFYERPAGTSDSIFQAFGRKYPHHPWKGWQEHHRIHKAKIDNLIAMLQRGESIDGEV
ncbi:hypothetical protein AN958_03464 [Leucoagaricus sp. SymC.cos]|nr:hypothetical protein AN958_03464 [Leucoagaricus sp. SymC.cos]